MKDKELKGVLNKHENKHEYDLYHEEDDVVLPLFRVKKLVHGNSEKWKVFSNDKVIFTIESTNLTKAQQDFLRTVEGFNFLMNLCKTKVPTVQTLRKQLRDLLTSKK